MKRTALILSVAFCLIFLFTAAFAGEQNVEKSFGQTVYVPAAYLDYNDELYTQTISTRLVIRNIDPHNPIKVNIVEFWGPDPSDNSPHMYRDFLDAGVVEFAPWRSTSYPTHISTLGVGPFDPNTDRQFFIVEWEANGRVIPPIIASSIAVVNYGDPNLIKALTVISGKVIKEK